MSSRMQCNICLRHISRQSTILLCKFAQILSYYRLNRNYSRLCIHCTRLLSERVVRSQWPFLHSILLYGANPRKWTIMTSHFRAYTRLKETDHENIHQRRPLKHHPARNSVAKSAQIPNHTKILQNVEDLIINTSTNDIIRGEASESWYLNEAWKPICINAVLASWVVKFSEKC